MTVIDFTDTYTLDISNTNAVYTSACVSRNEDNVMYVYLASISSSSSGPLVKCKQHSTHFTNCCVSLSRHGNVHWHVHVTGTILTANTTADALHLRTPEMSSQFLIVSRWGWTRYSNCHWYADYFFHLKANMSFYCYKWCVHLFKNRATLEDIVMMWRLL